MKHKIVGSKREINDYINNLSDGGNEDYTVTISVMPSVMIQRYADENWAGSEDDVKKDLIEYIRSCFETDHPDPSMKSIEYY